MKRVAVIAIFMAVMATLFAFPTYAAPTMGYSTNTDISSDDNNITAYMYAVYGERFDEVSSQGSNINTPYLAISIRIVNNTNKWVIKQTDQIKIRVNGITSVSSSLEISELVNMQIVETITASGRYDFIIKADNSFILSPNETYEMSFNLYSVGGFTASPTVQFFNNQFLNDAYTIDELVSLPADQLAYLATINESLSEVIAAQTYNGPGYSIDTQNYINKSITYTPITNTVNNISVTVRRLIYPVILNNVDFELNSGSDTLVSTQSYIYKVALYIYVNNYSNKPIQVNRIMDLSYIIPENVGFELNSFHSNIYNTYAMNYRTLTLGLTYKSSEGSNYGIIPWGKDYTFIQYTVYSPTKITNWEDFSLNFFHDTDKFVNGWYPESTEQLFYEWYNAYNKVNGLDDIDDTADDIKDKSESAHTQEQSYFTQNAQAIQQTGLSNYRFSNDQENGIGSVSHDFTLLWNALGGFNSIYIFSLTLSLALMILRHAPGVIRSTRRNKEE